MKKTLIVVLVQIVPLIFHGQIPDMNNLIEITNNQLRKIDRIGYSEDPMGYEVDVDSMSFHSNKLNKDIVLTLYYTELAFEEAIDNYVVGMDIPLLELIDIKKLDYQIRLDFSRTCNIISSEKERFINLNFSASQISDKEYQNLNRLLNFRNELHDDLHDFNKCNLDTK